jgi:hypothetical protein
VQVLVLKWDYRCEASHPAFTAALKALRHPKAEFSAAF